MVLAEQLDTCDKVCVVSYLGRVSKGQMRGIDEAVRIQLGYYIPEQAEKKRQGKCRKDGEEGDESAIRKASTVLTYHFLNSGTRLL